VLTKNEARYVGGADQGHGLAEGVEPEAIQVSLFLGKLGFDGAASNWVIPAMLGQP